MIEKSKFEYNIYIYRVKKEEIEMLGGQRDLEGTVEGKGDIFDNFYGKWKQVKEESDKFTNWKDNPMDISVDSVLDNMLIEANKHTDTLFTIEEGKGKYLDLHHIYNIYINLKKVFIYIYICIYR